MVQNAKEAEAPDYDELWEQLNIQQQDFVLGLLSGKTQYQAYIDAYQLTDFKDKNSVHSSASRLANSVKVRLLLNSMRDRQAVYTKDTHDEAMMRIALKAEFEGKHIAAINAHNSLAKSNGLYVDKVEDVTKRTPQETLQRIAETDPTIAATLAAKFNIPMPENTEKATKH